MLHYNTIYDSPSDPIVCIGTDGDSMVAEDLDRCDVAIAKRALMEQSQRAHREDLKSQLPNGHSYDSKLI